MCLSECLGHSISNIVKNLKARPTNVFMGMKLSEKEERERGEWRGATLDGSPKC